MTGQRSWLLMRADYRKRDDECTSRARRRRIVPHDRLASVDDWVIRALQRWPNVPALFGWLQFDRRGRWLIRGEQITHARIVEVINRNYACDDRGRWYFQNGPQRGYMTIEYAPLLLRATPAGGLVTHTGLDVQHPSLACLDEEGALTLQTEHGPGEIASADLDWALGRLSDAGRAIDEDRLAGMLALPSGSPTSLTLTYESDSLPIQRVDAAELPARLGFVREPAPE
jgi:hypothetical protein